MMACLPAMWGPPYSQVTLCYCIMHGPHLICFWRP
uniref:Uncharacterized protein n=1 Tax=Setaria viridis TaxID=4556 RepID=A0A4U6SXP4_SETVI|nr:hypothetical protein SEVIR_9G191750v2 [Setaria viridis]